MICGANICQRYIEKISIRIPFIDSPSVVIPIVLTITMIIYFLSFVETVKPLKSVTQLMPQQPTTSSTSIIFSIWVMDEYCWVLYNIECVLFMMINTQTQTCTDGSIDDHCTMHHSDYTFIINVIHLAFRFIQLYKFN